MLLLVRPPSWRHLSRVRGTSAVRPRGSSTWRRGWTVTAAWPQTSGAFWEDGRNTEVCFIILYKRKGKVIKQEVTSSCWMCVRIDWTACSSLPSGASAEEEDELYERGVVESNCVYRLMENRLVPEEQAWASIPSVSLLGSTEVWNLLWIL